MFRRNHIYPNIYCHLDYVSFDVVLSLFFEDEGMLHLSNLNNSARWICAEILFEWTHDLWDQPIKIWEAFSPVSKLISLFILLVTLCMSDPLRTTDAIWISACIVSRDPQLHMCTCDRLGWNTSRPWFQASLMEGICPEAFHLAHNREPGTHLDCICTVGAWPQRKEIIDQELPCCRGSGQLLVFLFTSGGNALIYMRANIKLWIVLAKPAPENRFMPVRVLDSC